MTIREIIDICTEGEEITPLLANTCFMTVAAMLRTLAHGEAATFEGEAASTEAVYRELGYRPTKESWEQFVQENPGILAIDIPERLVAEWIDADPEDGEA